MNKKPYLTIEVDEHSADAGVITRLEAFLDSLKMTRIAKSGTEKKVSRNISGNKRKVYIPYMDDHGFVLAAALRHNGIQAEALPMADEKTIETGRKYTTGKECFPCIITTGDIVRKALSNDFDPERSSFFMPSAMGPCRFGQYSRFHRMVLDDMGLKEVPFVILDQTTNYNGDVSRLGNGFRRLGWQAVILTDYLKKLLYHTRPYETNRGDSDAVYADCLEKLIRTVEQDGTLGDCGEYAVSSFLSVPVNRKDKKPLIGIIGEIFVRANQLSNNFVIRRIEELGGEAFMPTLQEWIEYTDWERRKDLLRMGNISGFMTEIITRRVQLNYVRKISKPFQGAIQHFFREIPTEKIMKLCSGYLDENIRGEATLSIGRALEYVHHGFNGIVNLIPFNCMPGTIVNSILWRFSKDYPNVPVLKMVYDGNMQSSDQTRLEAFMYQAQLFSESTNKERWLEKDKVETAER
jgi:predicted nucleotide-binding protein (sugar kinase/HSP70/actin superfamily)